VRQAGIGSAAITQDVTYLARRLQAREDPRTARDPELNRQEPAGEARAMRRRALVTLATISVWTVCGLWLDGQVGRTGQLILGVVTVCLLAAVLSLHAPAVRVQALGVVMFATLGEVVGSLIWGLYDYRFENLPAYVPPGHGLIYLAGFSLATLCTDRPRSLLAVAAIGAAVWGLAGLTVLPATDVAGAIGCTFLVLVLVTTRRAVYAGVFLVVAVLELYGTALGTWTWASSVPGLELSQGNPPSGVASGYVVFDVLALALAARMSLIMSLLETLRGRAVAAAQSISARIAARSIG
jgi:hypothetical protein